jgi:hypothetical protein
MADIKTDERTYDWDEVAAWMDSWFTDEEKSSTAMPSLKMHDPALDYLRCLWNIYMSTKWVDGL